MIKQIVTSQMGSWRWQKAYRIAEYAPRVTCDGRVILRSISRSGKYSWPQLRRAGWISALGSNVGSLHNKRPQIAIVDDYGNLVGAKHNGMYSDAI
jgi:hypothetical protein